MCPWFESRWYHNSNKRTPVRLLHFAPMPDHLSLPSGIYLDLQFSALRKHLDQHRPSSVVVIMDRNTEKHCLPALNPHLPPGTQFLGLSGTGERIKSLEHAHALWDSLDGLGMDRDGLIIPLGGGTVTDLGAFVASTYLRGVDCWLIPTSLLGMVDASIGGKTGVNFQGLKNRIGTISQPVGISIHPPFLQSLPQREWRSGMAEHIKHMLIHPDGTLDVLPTKDEHPIDPVAFTPGILSSIQVKSTIVAQDPLEKQGIRDQLNFGHTIGHAIESWAHETQTDVRHGEAIAWGMRVALRMSENHTACPKAAAGTFNEAIAWLQKTIPLPCAPPPPDTLWDIMLSDKKNKSGAMREVLLNGQGQPVTGLEIPFEAFATASDSIAAEAEGDGTW